MDLQAAARAPQQVADADGVDRRGIGHHDNAGLPVQFEAPRLQADLRIPLALPAQFHLLTWLDHPAIRRKSAHHGRREFRQAGHHGHFQAAGGAPGGVGGREGVSRVLQRSHGDFTPPVQLQPTGFQAHLGAARALPLQHHRLAGQDRFGAGVEGADPGGLAQGQARLHLHHRLA